MIRASCHCGQVVLDVDSAPAEVTSCNCSLCRRTAGLWAYYAPGQVQVRARDGDTDTYVWGDRSMAIHRCAHCGCVTHWVAFDPDYGRMGVNARLMEPVVLAAARVRRFDGADTWQYLD